MHFRLNESTGTGCAFELVDDANGSVVFEGNEHPTRDACLAAIREVTSSLRSQAEATLEAEGEGFRLVVTASGKRIATGVKVASREETVAEYTRIHTWITTSKPVIRARSRKRSKRSRNRDTVPKDAVRYDMDTTSESHKRGVEELCRASDGLYAYHFNDDRGRAILYSRGFASAYSRTKQIASMLQSAKDIKRFDGREDDGRPYFVLLARNGREVARSRYFESTRKRDATIRWVVGAAAHEAVRYPVRGKRVKHKQQKTIDRSRASVSGLPGFEGIKHGGKHFFHLNDADGKALLYSHGYRSASARDTGVRSLLRAGILANCYKIEPEGDQWSFCVKASNGRLLARSRVFTDRAEAEASAEWCQLVIVNFGKRYGVNQLESICLEIPLDMVATEASETVTRRPVATRDNWPAVERSGAANQSGVSAQGIDPERWVPPQPGQQPVGVSGQSEREPWLRPEAAAEVESLAVQQSLAPSSGTEPSGPVVRGPNDAEDAEPQSEANDATEVVQSEQVPEDGEEADDATEVGEHEQTVPKAGDDADLRREADDAFVADESEQSQSREVGTEAIAENERGLPGSEPDEKVADTSDGEVSGDEPRDADAPNWVDRRQGTGKWILKGLSLGALSLSDVAREIARGTEDSAEEPVDRDDRDACTEESETRVQVDLADEEEDDEDEGWERVEDVGSQADVGRATPVQSDTFGGSDTKTEVEGPDVSSSAVEERGRDSSEADRDGDIVSTPVDGSVSAPSADALAEDPGVAEAGQSGASASQDVTESAQTPSGSFAPGPSVSTVGASAEIEGVGDFEAHNDGASEPAEEVFESVAEFEGLEFESGSPAGGVFESATGEAGAFEPEAIASANGVDPDSVVPEGGEIEPEAISSADETASEVESQAIGSTAEFEPDADVSNESGEGEAPTTETPESVGGALFSGTDWEQAFEAAAAGVEQSASHDLVDSTSIAAKVGDRQRPEEAEEPRSVGNVGDVNAATDASEAAQTTTRDVDAETQSPPLISAKVSGGAEQKPASRTSIQDDSEVFAAIEDAKRRGLIPKQNRQTAQPEIPERDSRPQDKGRLVSQEHSESRPATSPAARSLRPPVQSPRTRSARKPSSPSAIVISTVPQRWIDRHGNAVLFAAIAFLVLAILTRSRSQQTPDPAQAGATGTPPTQPVEQPPSSRQTSPETPLPSVISEPPQPVEKPPQPLAFVEHCPVDAVDVGFVVNPSQPQPGASVKIVAATMRTEAELSMQLQLDGKVVASAETSWPGIPSFVIARVTLPDPGTYRAVVVENGKAIACTSFLAGDGGIPAHKQLAAGLWPIERNWNLGEEALYSAWVRRLFYARHGVGVTAKDLSTLTMDAERNFVFNAMGWREDDADHASGLYMQSTGVSLPYTLRAYWAWKRRLPFSARTCVRGTDGRASTCSSLTLPTPSSRKTSTRNYKKNAHGNIHGLLGVKRSATPKKTSEYDAVRQYLGKVLNSSVHTWNFQTAAGDPKTDFYPVQLGRNSLRPGTVYVDPYGGVLVVVEARAAGEASPGMLFAVDGQDGQIVRRRFGPGAFVWSPDRAVGEIGFKQFRPLDIRDGQVRQLDNREVASTRGDLWAGDETMSTEAFFHAVESALTPGVRDAQIEQLFLIDALYEAVIARAEVVQRATSRRKPVKMPGDPMRPTDGPWQTLSTFEADLRLLIALDAIEAFPQRVILHPEAFGITAEQAPQLRAELREQQQRLLTQQKYKFQYTRSDGSLWTIDLRDLSARAHALEVAYHPDDCPEIRWGAAEGSDEAKTCLKRASAAQRKRIQAYRRFFADRKFPPKK